MSNSQIYLIHCIFQRMTFALNFIWFLYLTIILMMKIIQLRKCMFLFCRIGHNKELKSIFFNFFLYSRGQNFIGMALGSYKYTYILSWRIEEHQKFLEIYSSLYIKIYWNYSASPRVSSKFPKIQKSWI